MPEFSTKPCGSGEFSSVKTPTPHTNSFGENAYPHRHSFGENAYPSTYNKNK